MHSQTQLMNTGVPAHADTLGALAESLARLTNRCKPSLRDIFSRQTHDIPTVTGTYTGALQTHMLPPEPVSITLTHLPTAAGWGQPSSWPTPPAEQALLWASLWWQRLSHSESLLLHWERLKEKRTLGTREVSAFLSDWEEGCYISSFPSDSGSDHFPFVTLGTVAQSTNLTRVPPLIQYNK